MADKSYYEILGVDKNASADEMKSAYRRLAKKYHPDLYSNAPDAEKKKVEAQFKEINHAYDVLSDSQKRAAYDAYGNENGPVPGADGSGFSGFSGFGGGGGNGGFGFDVDDIFSSIFSGFGGQSSSRGQRQNAPQNGQDILLGMTITFEEAAFGVEHTISVKRVENCADCGGTGAKDGKAFKVCPTCGGSGNVTQTQRTPFGQFSTTGVCPNCKGKGKIITETCKTCSGQGRYEKARDIKVNIPAGIDAGQRITYQGEGHAGKNGGGRGNLIVEISIRPHTLFKRAGSDIQLEVPVTIAEAALGCTIMVPTLGSKQELKVPEGTQSGTIFKLKGCGIKKLRGLDKGDMFVKVIVEVPKTISREQKELLRKLDVSFESKQFPRKKEYTEKQ
ncbi:MAG: molecular chaperone DnaJ [Clostridia bacterium]